MPLPILVRAVKVWRKRHGDRFQVIRKIRKDAGLARGLTGGSRAWCRRERLCQFATLGATRPNEEANPELKKLRYAPHKAPMSAAHLKAIKKYAAYQDQRCTKEVWKQRRVDKVKLGKLAVSMNKSEKQKADAADAAAAAAAGAFGELEK